MILANYIRSTLCKTCKWDKEENALQNPACVSCRQMMIVRVDNYEQAVPGKTEEEGRET